MPCAAWQWGFTPLHWAVCEGQTAVARALERSLPPTLSDAMERWVRPELDEEERGLREVK